MQEGQRRSRVLLALLLALAACAYAWGIASQPPLQGYDPEGHLHYVATIVDEWRVPAPLEGWSTFHPPLYHLLLAAIAWPSAPRWPPMLLEGVSAVAVLLAGAAAFHVTRVLGHAPLVSALATALLLFVPCVQLAATTIGNEALTAAFAALAAGCGVSLQADPRSARRAVATGALVGLATATKFSGVFALPAAVVPYLRADLDRRALRAAALAAAALVAVVAAPYARNVAATGSLLPMTREREPVASVERVLTLRPRRVADYLWLDPAVFRAPVVHALRKEDAGPRGLNPAMTNVWGLAYASAWYDAHEVRVPDAVRVSAARAGSLLLLLGVVPTALLLLGAAASARDVVRRGSAEPRAPLVGMAALGLLGFVAFTARAPAAPAVKAAYLMPLLVPAAAFFARGVQALAARLRPAALCASGVAVVASAVVFANGVVWPAHAREVPPPPPWMSPEVARVARALDAAAEGRWIRIQANPGAGGAVRWRLVARTYPPLRGPEVAVWCDWIGRTMRELAPAHAWRAAIVQADEVRHCGA